MIWGFKVFKFTWATITLFIYFFYLSIDVSSKIFSLHTRIVQNLWGLYSFRYAESCGVVFLMGGTVQNESNNPVFISAWASSSESYGSYNSYIFLL